MEGKECICRGGGEEDSREMKEVAVPERAPFPNALNRPPDPSGLSPKAGEDEGDATAQSSIPSRVGARLHLA